MLEFHVFDVFTDRPYAGNPLAIVKGADDLATDQMQTMARQFNLSETIFVQTPDDPAHTAKVRIFFPTAEIPFAGHPTIGCAIHLALEAAGEGDFETEITLEEVAGLVPVQVSRRSGEVSAEFVAPKLPVPHEGQIDPSLIAAALGLAESQIGFGAHAPALWQAGPEFLFVPVPDHAALAKARPTSPAWQRLEQVTNEAVYVYAPGASFIDYQARMFAPAHGMPEDPATGSASAILAAQLMAAGALKEGETHLTLAQGVEMGRPSRIGLTVLRRADGALQEIRVSGSAVPVMSGQLTPPAA